MTFGKVLFGMCCVFFTVGTVGAIKGAVSAARMRKKQKQYAEARSNNQ